MIKLSTGATRKTSTVWAFEYPDGWECYDWRSKSTTRINRLQANLQNPTAAKGKASSRRTKVEWVIPRYLYCLSTFSMPLVDAGLEEQAVGNWLEMDSPWELEKIHFAYYNPAASVGSNHSQRWSTVYTMLNEDVDNSKASAAIAGIQLIHAIPYTQWLADRVYQAMPLAHFAIFDVRLDGWEWIEVVDGIAVSSRFLEIPPAHEEDWVDAIEAARDFCPELPLGEFPLVFVGEEAKNCWGQLESRSPLGTFTSFHCLDGSFWQAAEGNGQTPSGGNLLLPPSFLLPPKSAWARWRPYTFALLLLILLGFGQYDRTLRKLDQDLAIQRQLLKKMEEKLQEAPAIQETFLAVQDRWSRRRNWLADLDAISEPLVARERIVLESIDAQSDRDGGAPLLRLTGSTPDHNSWMQLLEVYGEDARHEKVRPESFRPVEREEGERIEFDVVLVESQTLEPERNEGQ
jgi:hypothetical protein